MAIAATIKLNIIGKKNSAMVHLQKNWLNIYYFLQLSLQAPILKTIKKIRFD